VQPKQLWNLVLMSIETSECNWQCSQGVFVKMGCVCMGRRKRVAPDTFGWWCCSWAGLVIIGVAD
jgi:hypothetical protein